MGGSPSMIIFRSIYHMSEYFDNFNEVIAGTTVLLAFIRGSLLFPRLKNFDMPVFVHPNQSILDQHPKSPLSVPSTPLAPLKPR